MSRGKLYQQNLFGSSYTCIDLPICTHFTFNHSIFQSFKKLRHFCTSLFLQKKMSKILTNILHIEHNNSENVSTKVFL